MSRRRAGSTWAGAGGRQARIGRRENPQNLRTRVLVLGGIVHCATGHNPLRMQGDPRKGNTYCACGYRISYGDKAAHAFGHGNGSTSARNRIADLIDRFFATRSSDPGAAPVSKPNMPTSSASSRTATGDQPQRLTRQLADLDQRVQRQLAAIEAGVDAVLGGDRICALKAEHHDVEAAIAELDDDRRQRTGLHLDDACAVLDGLPNLPDALAAAAAKLRRQVYDAFRLTVEIDRDEAQIRVRRSSRAPAPYRRGLGWASERDRRSLVPHPRRGCRCRACADLFGAAIVRQRAAAGRAVE